MPVSAVLVLECTKSGALNSSTGRLVHAALFHLWRRGSERMARQVHDRPDKGFAVSPLYALGGRLGSRPLGVDEVEQGERYWVRLSFLDEELYRLTGSVLLKGDQYLRLDQAAFEPLELFSTESVSWPSLSRWVGRESWEQMATSPRAERWRVRFVTPTAFRATVGEGRSVVWVLPDPVRCWQSWVRSWNTFAPQTYEEEPVGALARRVAIGMHQLRTESVRLGHVHELGFVGRCTYVAVGNFSDAELSVLTALWRLSFYCGTGRKTAMGMGQTLALVGGCGEGGIQEARSK